MVDLDPAQEDIATDAEAVEAAIRLGDELAETGIVGREQARVYAMRDVYGIRRGIVADVLEKHPRTVDSNLRGARKNIEGAQECVRLIEEATGDE